LLVVALAAAAAVLASCTTGVPRASHVSAPATSGVLASTTGEPGPHVGVAIDVGRVRLWLPSGWRLVADDCIPDSTALCFPSCPVGQNDTITVAAYSAILHCQIREVGDAAVWIAPRRLGTGPATWRRLRIGHGSVVVQVPRLGVTLYGFTALGARVAMAFTPSTLERLLEARLPTAVPRHWRRIAYGNLSIDVPPSWPVTPLADSRLTDPGACGLGDFSTPVADLGTDDVTPMCPIEFPNEWLRTSARPVNAVWLQVPGVWLDPARNDARRVHGMTINLRPMTFLTGSDALQVLVRRGSSVGDLVLGLGTSPTVAEAILSSLRLRGT
jgi:hypothetical protein